ncbi:trimethylamine--corrinoid methyltransferase [Desulfitibacter alkalitolerans]|uniref:trimethylamine--corrinoid methyltransferase n=1 Tax=Desulfitibacter alkalitolerans TaxID=264641 RepID=UPI0004883D4B|nr:trimethylamine--corrinoid methyltransferase [Desulfitibacter alkalitolerans]
MVLKTKLEVIAQEDYQMIHDASIKILEETGVAFHSEEALEICKHHGARVLGNTVYFTRKMVEEAIKECPKTFSWTARNAEKSVTVGEGFLIQPNLGPVFIQDLDRGKRAATLEDFSNIQKLCQYSDVVHLVGSIPVNPGDVPQNEKHLHIIYETLKNTDKPVIGHTGYRYEARETLDMVEIALGRKLEHGHYVGVAINPLSPLSYSRDALETIMEYANRNQIVFLAPCIMAGVSGPITLLGTALLQNVEILAGLTFIQLINPGNPVLYSIASNTAYMKTGSFIGGNPEGLLMDIINLQMGLDYYKVPTRILAGITDAKVVDCQAGYETMQNLMLGVLGGGHIVVQCMGVLDAIMTTSYEKFIIDEELIKRMIRIKQGVEVSEEELAIAAIQELGHKGSYLTHESTFEKFRSRWMPTISTCESYMDWEAAGSKDVVVRANRKYKKILGEAPATLLEKDLEKSLKEYMNIVKK